MLISSGIETAVRLSQKSAAASSPRSFTWKFAGGHFRNSCEISSCSLQRVLAAKVEFKLIYSACRDSPVWLRKRTLLGSVHAEFGSFDLLSSYTVVPLNENRTCQVDGGSLHSVSRTIAFELVKSLISKAVVRS